ncbi:MAG: Slp family lipoprotein [Gammaproteobacteria bacterium]|nr:Slp family lipoprotein [Gammaproteobacteria bacterium]
MKFLRVTRYIGWFLVLMVLSACSTHIPLVIKQPFEGAPGIGGVRDKADTGTSQKVRLGGVILQTENMHDNSCVTILAFPLKGDGEAQIFYQRTGDLLRNTMNLSSL